MKLRGRSALQFVGSYDLYSLFEIEDSSSSSASNDFVLFAHLKIDSASNEMSLTFFVKSQFGMQAQSLTVIPYTRYNYCGGVDCLLIGGGLVSGSYSNPFLMLFPAADTIGSTTSAQTL